jgi:uncharacterized protein GlcG (DUF336 family)
MALNSTRAQALVTSAMADAERRGESVSVAVVDSGGFLTAFARSNGASPYTADVAIGKAYGVIFFGRSSAEIQDMATARPNFFAAVRDLGLRALIPSPGGIAIEGGAIGVSGAASGDEDVEIATAAIASVPARNTRNSHRTATNRRPST